MMLFWYDDFEHFQGEIWIGIWGDRRTQANVHTSLPTSTLHLNEIHLKKISSLDKMGYDNHFWAFVAWELFKWNL